MMTMMAVNFLHLSAVSTAASFVALQWWAFSLLDSAKSDGFAGAGAVELVLGSRVTVALLAGFAVNAFLLVVLCLKTLFFVQMYPSETQKVLERIVNYVILKGIFLPLAVRTNTSQVLLWTTWLIIMCSLKMFQSFARDRLERLNASPMVTPSKYFRVFSALLFVLSADFLWIILCTMIYRSFSSSLFLLLFFEPLCVAFETLQAVMVHGFQLFDIWQRHSTDNDDDIPGSEDSCKSAAGSLSEWKGVLIRNCGFVLDLMTLFMALGHYLIIWWLHGMTFHLVDALLFVNLRALVSAMVKRVRGYIKLRRALGILNGALPDATFEELCAFNDECAICREPMAKAKKLACSHLFHLACLKSWLDQGLTEVYSCPTCRRPLFSSNTRNLVSSLPEQVPNNQRVTEQPHTGLGQERITGHQMPAATFPNQQRNPTDTVWRGVGLDPSWMPTWPNPGLDGAGTSSAIRSVGLSGVQMMMRQLASVSENYAHSSLDDTARNFWHSGQASGSSAPPSSLLRYNGNVPGLRFRSTSLPTRGITSGILAMADRVREVLPHIPDELIIQDLLRTNNVNITVNNLLLVQ